MRQTARPRRGTPSRPRSNTTKTLEGRRTYGAAEDALRDPRGQPGRDRRADQEGVSLAGGEAPSRCGRKRRGVQADQPGLRGPIRPQEARRVRPGPQVWGVHGQPRRRGRRILRRAGVRRRHGLVEHHREHPARRGGVRHRLEPRPDRLRRVQRLGPAARSARERPHDDHRGPLRRRPERGDAQGDLPHPLDRGDRESDGEDSRRRRRRRQAALPRARRVRHERRCARRPCGDDARRVAPLLQARRGRCAHGPAGQHVRGGPGGRHRRVRPQRQGAQAQAPCGHPARQDVPLQGHGRARREAEGPDGVVLRQGRRRRSDRPDRRGARGARAPARPRPARHTFGNEKGEVATCPSTTRRRTGPCT